ncbi:hypothetical protein SUGI_0145080 [Cryptomeria japonica]|nr:hypothetical protein SUGI_0145080 [Cryptomeria japonica]
MDIHMWPFEGTNVFRDAQMKSLSAEPLAVRVVQMMASEESLLPSIWALGGILMALVATVASIITGARMIRLKLQEKRAEHDELVRNELAILSSVSLDSSYEDEGTEMPSCSSSSSSHLFPSQEIRMMKRKKRREQAMEWMLEDPNDLFTVRETQNWATLRGYEMAVWESPKKKSNCSWSEFSNLDERRPVPALFRPLLESFSKMEEYSEYEGEEMLNTNFKYAWELGKSKLRQWQQENLPSFAVRGPYNSLFGREDVVKFWDNLKGRALRTFYVQQGFVSAMDSGWMSGIASLGNTSQGLLSLWDLDRATSVSRISGNRAEIQGLYMESSNTIITGGPDGTSGKTALKLWDTRMGPRPAAVNEPDLLVPRRIVDMKSDHLHKLYIRDDSKTVSIHELRMLGGGPISTLTLEDPTAIPVTKVGEQNLLSNCSFADMEETEERTWWDEDAVIVSDEEDSVSDDEEDDCYDIKDNLQPNNDANKKSVVSWCLGAVRSISSSLGKQEL